MRIRMDACAAVVAFALVVTSCSAVNQRSPEATMETFLEHVSQGEMADACELVDEGLRQLTDRFGGCQTVMRSDFTPEVAQPLAEAVVDKTKITVFGDGATLGDGAVTVNGESANLKGYDALVKHDGKWWVSAS